MGQCSSTSKVSRQCITKVPELTPLDGTGSASESSNDSSHQDHLPPPIRASRRGSFFKDSASTPVGEDTSDAGIRLLQSIQRRIPNDDDDDGDDSDSFDTIIAVVPSPVRNKTQRPQQQQKQQPPKCLDPWTKNIRTQKMRERSLPALLEKDQTVRPASSQQQQQDAAEVSSVSKRLNNSLSSLKFDDNDDDDDDDNCSSSVSKRLACTQYMPDDNEQADQLPDLPRSSHSYRLSKKSATRTSIQVADLEKHNDLQKDSTSSWYQLSCTSRTGSTYSSYHSFGQSNLSELEVTLMASQQSLGASHCFIDRMHLSRTEKNALSGLHGFCFTESEDENDASEDEQDDDEQVRAAAAEELILYR